MPVDGAAPIKKQNRPLANLDSCSLLLQETLLAKLFHVLVLDRLALVEGAFPRREERTVRRTSARNREDFQENVSEWAAAQVSSAVQASSPRRNNFWQGVLNLLQQIGHEKRLRISCCVISEASSRTSAGPASAGADSPSEDG